MADLKISQLTDGGASQATDEYVVARSGSNFRIDGASVAAAATSVGTLSSLTVSGDLTVDTNTLYVDSANNNVGIGTTTTAGAVYQLTAYNNATSGQIALCRDAGNKRGAVYFGRLNSGSFQITSSIISESDTASPNNGALVFGNSDSSGTHVIE